MASPFDLFRKNQKIMMAVLGIMCMMVFVLTDSMSSIFSPGGGGGGDGPDSKTVAVTDNLTLTERDVSMAVYNRQLVQQFLTRALSASFKKRQLLQLRQELKGESEETVLQQLEMLSQQIEAQVRFAVVNSIGSADERSVVDNLVLADLAKRSGVQISNKRITGFVNDFIREFRVDPVEGEQLDAIVRNMQNVTQAQLNEAFRTELLAGSMADTWAINPAFAPGDPALRIPSSPVATPIDRWNYYTRQKLRATAEVLAVRTADIVKAKKIGAPQERELIAFFDKYKFEEPVPGSPEPGFKIPQQAAFQYFAADEAAFIEADKVTPAEIAEHYEKNKARYPYTPEDFSEPVKKEEPKPATPATSTPPASTPATPATPSTTTPSTSSKPAPAATPSATPAASAPKPTATPSASAAATSAPTSKPSATPSASPKPGPSPSASTPKPTPSPSASPSASKPAGGSCESPLEEADLADDSCQSPAASASATPSATPSASAAKPQPSATPTATPSATASTAPAATPTASPSGTASAPAAALPPLPLPSEDVMLPDDVRTGKEPQYDPLWKVEDKIRKELAEAAVRKRIETIFNELRAKMVDKSTSRPYEATTDAKAAPLYSKEEWLALAKPYPGLAADVTPLMSRLQVVAQADAPGLFHSTVGGVPFSQAAFASHTTYAPQESIEIPATESVEAILTHRKTVHYLYWKTEDIEAKVPELNEVRDEVVLAWQNRAARDLAQQEAAAMAKRLVDSPAKPMSELFPDKEVKLTNSFTWFKPDLSGGFGRQQQTEISEVDNVEDAGPEFMEAVFSLNDNEVTTAFNKPKTVCYVIRAVTISPPRASLYTTFLTDPFMMYMQYGQADANQLARESIQSLLAESGLKWLREPKPFDPNR